MHLGIFDNILSSNNSIICLFNQFILRCLRTTECLIMKDIKYEFVSQTKKASLEVQIGGKISVKNAVMPKRVIKYQNVK